jgi:hypothetical protein
MVVNRLQYGLLNSRIAPRASRLNCQNIFFSNGNTYFFLVILIEIFILKTIILKTTMYHKYRVILNDCDFFFFKLETFFINYFGKLDTLINTLAYAYVRHFDILCINKLCQIDEDAYVYVNYHIKKQNNQQ